MPESDLATLQAWMLESCTAPGASGTALRHDHLGDRAEVAATIKDSDLLSCVDRLGIYARGYLARLLEGLGEEFPALRALVGDQVFDLFARAYIGARPPTSYSRFDLGAGFADYLDDTRPQPRRHPGSIDALPAALARLERARLETGRARGVETDPDHGAVDLLQLTTTPGLKVRTPESLRLLRLEFELASLIDAAHRGTPPTTADPSDTFHATARNGYHITVHVLTPWQHTFLEACGAEAVDLDMTVCLAAEKAGAEPCAYWGALLAWLPRAVNVGMVTVF